MSFGGLIILCYKIFFFISIKASSVKVYSTCFYHSCEFFLMQYNKLPKREHLEIAYTYYLIISRVRNPGIDYLGPLLKVSHDCIQTVMLAGSSSQLLLGVLFSGSLVIVRTFSLCNCKMEVTAFFSGC